MFNNLKISTKNNLSIWFNSEKKKEFYYAPVIRYKTILTRLKQNRYQSIKLDDEQVNDKIYYSTQELSNPYEEEFGTFLIKYLNADFSSFEKSYYSFFCYYGFSILKKYYKDIVVTKSFTSKEDFINTFEPIFTRIKPVLNKMQNKFKKCVDYIYDINNNSTIYYSKIEKFTLCSIQNSLLGYFKDTKVINFEQFSKSSFNLKNPGLKQIQNFLDVGIISFNNSPIYSSSNIINLVYISLLECVKTSDLRITKCQNCGKYFISYKKSEKYCNITYFPDEIPCKKKGATQFYTKKKQSVEWLKIYRNEYQKRLMQIKRSNDEKLKNNFESWKIESKNKIKDYKNDLINQKKLLELLQK